MKTRLKEITVYIICGFIVGVSLGFVLGLSLGYRGGSQNTTEIRNRMLDIKPYDASLQIKDLDYSDISPAGFTVEFDTDKTTGHEIAFDDINGLVIEWGIYPLDIFSIDDIQLKVIGKPSLRATVETYPEGGTVAFRIVDQKTNTGSLWYYIDLPRPEEAVLPPPYMPRNSLKEEGE